MTLNFSLEFRLCAVFVCSIVMVDVRYGDFYLCIPLNILHQLMYNLACNKFPPGVAGVDRTICCLRRNIIGSESEMNDLLALW